MNEERVRDQRKGEKGKGREEMGEKIREGG